jgi:hypothetical protein
VKGVSMFRTTFRPHAHCVGSLDSDVVDCPWERRGGTFTSPATVRSDAQHHVQQTGHTVLVDILDQTTYVPE